MHNPPVPAQEQTPMGMPRSLGRSEAEAEFDRRAATSREVTCINVSPFAARFTIGTVPGSEPRFYKLNPGERVNLQHGYTVEFLGAGRQPVRPTIESLTEREAWPGVRIEDADGKLQWQVKPGPRLPMVVALDRADEVRAQWEAAVKQRDEAKIAPLRMTLQRTDGSRVEVDATVEDAVRSSARAPAVNDDEDQTGGLDEPPPDHDEPLEPVTLPSAKPDPVPTRGGRRGG